MRSIYVAAAILLAPTSVFASESAAPLWGALEAGSQNVGFRLVEVNDSSRVYPQPRAGTEPRWRARPLRMYVWYPTQDAAVPTLALRRFAGMAAKDFDLIQSDEEVPKTCPPLPVPLAHGVQPAALEELLDTHTASRLNAAIAPGRFPVLVLAQGLYYESPLSQLVLSEYLASWGYVVVTCPLNGTHCRLVHLNVTDLETVTRDLEFVLGQILVAPGVDQGHVGAIGYDMGGMAAITLAMRDPRVQALVSLDAGILNPHFSGLPHTHPSYNLARLSIPWMHMTQARFVEAAGSQGSQPTAMAARKFGDNFLLSINTTNHGSFSSYAMFGMETAVAGYWESVPADQRAIYEAVCLGTRQFLDAYLKGSDDAVRWLSPSAEHWQSEAVITDVERRTGCRPPDLQEPWIHRMIRDGVDNTLPALRAAQSQCPEVPLVDEQELNWLGYHLLLWWGRPAEAIPVFQLLVDTYPDSANGVDSLAEALLVNGDRPEAIRYYRKALEMNPDNRNAQAALKRLLEEH